MSDGDVDEQHRHWARTLFNDTWRLMDKPDRTPDEDAELVHRAHASAYHWLRVGAPANVARGHWQCRRAYRRRVRARTWRT